MTLSTLTSRVDYVGDGATTVFPVPFQFFGHSELRVIRRVLATGAETVLTLGVDYTVSGGNGATGTVTASTAPPNTVQWTILRNTNRTQETQYLTGDPFPAASHERALDRLTALIQEAVRDQARSVRVAETDAAAVVLPSSVARAQKFLAFDASGAPVAVELSLSGNPVTPYAAGLLNCASATAARTYLGATTTGAALFTAADAAAARTAVGATATGSSLITAADAAAARTAIGATTTGSSLITATDAAAARTAIGATATGSSLITAASAAAARTAIGATTTGSSLITAADEAAARTAIGATATGSSLITATDAAAARAALGGTTVGIQVFTAATAADARAAISAPPTPTNASSPGQWQHIVTSPGGTWTLPSGGTWAYHVRGFTTGGVCNLQFISGVAAGGTAIISSPSIVFEGLAWRLA